MKRFLSMKVSISHLCTIGLLGLIAACDNMDTYDYRKINDAKQTENQVTEGQSNISDMLLTSDPCMEGIRGCYKALISIYPIWEYSSLHTGNSKSLKTRMFDSADDYSYFIFDDKEGLPGAISIIERIRGVISDNLKAVERSLAQNDFGANKSYQTKARPIVENIRKLLAASQRDFLDAPVEINRAIAAYMSCLQYLPAANAANYGAELKKCKTKLDANLKWRAKYHPGGRTCLSSSQFAECAKSGAGASIGSMYVNLGKAIELISDLHNYSACSEQGGDCSLQDGEDPNSEKKCLASGICSNGANTKFFPSQFFYTSVRDALVCGQENQSIYAEFRMCCKGLRPKRMYRSAQDWSPYQTCVKEDY
jgi:hypothetical protein